MGGKNKKPASAKKKRQQQQRGKGKGQPPCNQEKQRSTTSAPPSLDEVLSQADAALDASDIENALGLYTYAADVLRRRLIDGDADGKDGGGGGGAADAGEEGDGGDCNDDDAVLLSRVLGRAGEARVSLGDQEGGREAFLEAIELLGRRGGGGGGDDDDDDDSNDERMDDGACGGPSSSPADAKLCEVRAGLHLYLGQLSSDREALDSYRAGVRDLERCAKILEGLVAASAASSSDGMEEDGSDGGTSLETALTETRRQLCGAHCSIADLFMTDLCYDPDAEARCESALVSALALDGDGASSSIPDALQARANLRLSQRRGDDAVLSILDAYDRMKVGCEAMADLVGLGRERDDGDGGGGGAERGEEGQRSGKKDSEGGNAKELLEVDAANSLPGFEFRCQTAKILLECAAYLSDDDGDEGEEEAEKEGLGANGDQDDEDDGRDDRRKSCVEASIQVLGSLLAENDEVVEVWYLLGCAFEASNPPDVDAAQYYWETALTMLAKVKESMDDEQQGRRCAEGMSGVNDGEEDCGSGLSEVVEQMNELKEKLACLGDEKMPPKDVEMGDET